MIECTRFKSVAKGTLQGFADIFVHKWNLEIRGVTLMMKDGKRWVNLPSKEFKDSEGQIKYAPIIKFRSPDGDEAKAKAMLEEFGKLIRQAIDAYCSKNVSQEGHLNQAAEDDLPF